MAETNLFGDERPAQRPPLTTERVERTVALRKVDTKPHFVWEATVRFTTSYNLPDNVVEGAVTRAIADDKSAQVLSLAQLIEASSP